MYKASIEIGRINPTLAIKFGLIISSETDIKTHTKLVNKFNFGGNDYIRISPKPFITIDISSKLDKDEGWSTNRTATLNRFSLFKFITTIEKEIRFFKEKPNLFFYEHEKLKLNKVIAKDCVVTTIAGNKALRLQPCVVQDEENELLLYEGCVLCINSFDNFAYMTYDELVFMHHVLREINMTTLSMELINMVTLYNKTPSSKLPPKKPIVAKDVVEEIIIEDNKKVIKPKDEKVIPDI